MVLCHMELVIIQLINGIQLGAIYALMALGYTMVYGILKLINFAHGDLLMIAAYVAYFLVNLHVPLPVAFVASMAVGALGAIIMDKVAYKPLRSQPRLKALITAMGVSLLLENGCRALPFIGPSFRRFPDVINVKNFSLTENIIITNIQIINLVMAISLMLMLWFIIRKTKLGIAMRAVSLDPKGAKLMGVNVERVISATFALGGALAGAAGVLTAITYPRLSPYMGIMPGLKAFIAAVFGGIGSIPGAMVGGMLMGIIETAATAVNSQMAEGFFFLLLLVVLLIRPFGLFGKSTREKV